MLDRQIASVIWESSEYGITCMMDCEVLCEDCGGIEEKDLWVIIVSLGGAIIALIIIFSCAIHYLKKKYRNKLAAVRTGSIHKTYCTLFWPRFHPVLPQISFRSHPRFKSYFIPVSSIFHPDSTRISLRFHSNFTLILPKFHQDFTQISLRFHPRFHWDFTEISLRFHSSFTKIVILSGF